MSMKTQNKPTIADVLWFAANKHLAIDDATYVPGKYTYSCGAARNAAAELVKRCEDIDTDRFQDEVTSFLKGLGVRPRGFHEFREFADYPSPVEQGARYLWLMFAHEVAKDRGV